MSTYTIDPLVRLLAVECIKESTTAEEAIAKFDETAAAEWDDDGGVGQDLADGHAYIRDVFAD